MAKAVSTVLSISLLIGANRAAEFWQRTHNHDNAAQMDSWTLEYAYSNTPRVIPTNLAVKAGATLIPLEP